MTTENGQRRTAFLLIAAGAAIVVTATLLIPGIAPWSPPSGSAAASAANSCVVSYGALDPANTAKSNPAKESEFAIGVPVTASDEAGVKAELKERRTCGADGKFDPNVTATHYAGWSASGLTSRKVDYANIDAFRAEMIANSDLYAATVTELESLENASAFSVEKVPAGMWSVYAVPDGKGGLTTHMGRSGHVGTAAVFTHGSVVINYRLECGFQILLPAPPAGTKVCANAECQPTTHVPTCEEANNCQPPPCTVPTSCLEQKHAQNSVGATQGTAQLGQDPVKTTAPAPKSNPVYSPVPANNDAGTTIPVSGASTAPVPVTPAPAVPQAPTPATPGPVHTDPDTTG